MSTTTDDSAASLHIYGDDMSQPSRAVFLFCLENNIPFVKHQIIITKNQQLTEEYKKINPRQQIPAIVDGGYHLFESHAILRYLADSRQVPEHWYPKNLHQRGLVNAWLDWRDSHLRYGCFHYLQAEILYKALGLNLSEETRKVWKKRGTFVLRQSLNIITEELQRDNNHPFICGTEISIVDLSFSSEIAMLALVPYDLSHWPPIQRWMQRVQQRCQHWNEVNAMLNKAIAKRQTITKQETQTTDSSTKEQPTTAPKQQMMKSNL